MLSFLILPWILAVCDIGRLSPIICGTASIHGLRRGSALSILVVKTMRRMSLYLLSHQIRPLQRKHFNTERSEKPYCFFLIFFGVDWDSGRIYNGSFMKSRHLVPLPTEQKKPLYRNQTRTKNQGVVTTASDAGSYLAFYEVPGRFSKNMAAEDLKSQKARHHLWLRPLWKVQHDENRVKAATDRLYFYFAPTHYRPRVERTNIQIVEASTFKRCTYFLVILLSILRAGNGSMKKCLQ